MNTRANIRVGGIKDKRIIMSKEFQIGSEIGSRPSTHSKVMETKWRSTAAKHHHTISMSMN